MSGILDWFKKTFSGNRESEQDDQSVARMQIDAIMAKERSYMGRDEQVDGETLAVIELEVEAPDGEKAEIEGGIYPWINLEDRANELVRLRDSDELVLPYARAFILFDYPLNNPAIREIATDGQGFTRRELVELIGKFYEEIYEEEERSANIKTLPMNERKIMNRNQTDGVHGIWGHDLADIAISYIEVRRRQDSEILLTLGIES